MIGEAIQRLPGLNDRQGVPAGNPTITATSFNEPSAAGVGVTVDVSCEDCPNAVPQANAQASAQADALAANNLVITPPREFCLCS